MSEPKFTEGDEVRIIADSYWDESQPQENHGKSPYVGELGIIEFLFGDDDVDVRFGQYDTDGYRESDLELVTPAVEVQKRPRKYYVSAKVAYEATYVVSATSRAEAIAQIRNEAFDEDSWTERWPVKIDIESVVTEEEM